MPRRPDSRRGRQLLTAVLAIVLLSGSAGGAVPQRRELTIIATLRGAGIGTLDGQQVELRWARFVFKPDNTFDIRFDSRVRMAGTWEYPEGSTQVTLRLETVVRYRVQRARATLSLAGDRPEFLDVEGSTTEGGNFRLRFDVDDRQ